MPIVSLDELNFEPLPVPKAPSGLSMAYIENDVDLSRERHALSFAADLRAKGYRMYIDGRKPAEIAAALKVEPYVVLAWSRDGQWGDRMRKENNDREALVREGMRKARLEHAEDDVRESLELGQRIRRVVRKKLENPDDLRSQDIKNYADAAKATGDLADHGLGSTAGENVGGSAAAQNAAGKKPLVVIFNGGTAPVIKNAE